MGAAGPKGYCWPCEKAYLLERNNGAGNAKRRAVARNSRRRNHWASVQRMYGITQIEYDALLERQGGRCAICRTDTVGGNGKRWHIDHDHATGIVRGLLCMKCNLGLGYFDEDHHRMINACIYLGAVPSSPIGFFKEVS